MANVSSNASCNPSSLTISGNTQVNGTISWSKPDVPSGATISSCVLTGDATASIYKSLGDLNKIAEYKFNNTLYDLIPEFNAEFVDYTYEDIVEGEITTRTIYNVILPTKIMFGITEGTPNNKSLSLLEVSYLNTDNLNTAYCMFNECRNVRLINTSNWNTSNITDLSKTFSNCYEITALDLTNWDTGNVIDFTWLFTNCYNLTSVGNISKWDTSNVTCFDSMFFECSSLSELDLSNWNTNNVEDMGWIFYSCESLNKINISNWNTSKVTYIDGIFYESNNIDTIIMKNSDYNSVNKIIDGLPTRETTGYLYVQRNIIDDINVSEAESKQWKIIPIGGKIKNIFIGNDNVSNMIAKINKKIKGVYLGDNRLL